MSTEENYVIEGFDGVGEEGVKGWDGSGGAPNIDPGEYALEVISCKVEATKAGDGKNVVVEYEIVSEGMGAGETFRQWYLIAGPKFKLKGHGGRIAHVFRDSLKVPGINPSSLAFETKRAVGRRMWAMVTLATTDKWDPETQTHKQYTNINLSQERPMEEDTAAAAPPPPAPPAKAPSAPPARPPAPPARPAAPPVRAR